MSGRTKEGGAERGEQLPDPAFVLGEARAHDAGVKAVGAKLGGAPGELACKEDVAQLGGAIHAHSRVGAHRLEVLQVQQTARMSVGSGGHDTTSGEAFA